MTNTTNAMKDTRKQELERQEWYHGFRSRKDVSVLLKNPGDFLLRVTDSNKFTTIVISVMNERKDIKHLTLIFENNLWQLSVLKDKGKTAPGFKTIVELVDYYKQNPLPIKTKLKRGIIRPIWLIKHDQVSFSKTKDLVGSGNFCHVYKGIYKRANEFVNVAVKICHDGVSSAKNLEETKDTRNAMLAEAEIMSYYTHNHVIQFFGVACDHPPILILMEFCPGGNLERHLKTQGNAISTGERLIFALEAARGMNYLHSQNCIHRDLAARNCLISVDGKIKISDFGLSQILTRDSEGKEEEANTGTLTQIPLRWMAPESLQMPMKFSSKSDIWSFGVLLYEIFNNGIKPFADDDAWPIKKIATYIRKGRMPDMPSRTPKEIVDLTKSMWILEREERPSMVEICSQIFKVAKDYQAPQYDQLTINKVHGVRRKEETLEETIDMEEDHTRI